MDRKYILTENDEQGMRLGRFDWRIDGNNNATLSWEWPANREVRLMIIFASEDEAPDIASLLQSRPPEVVVRDLASSYTVNIPEGRRKFLACPAYFEGQAIAVYKPAYITGWLYKKTKITTSVTYKPLFLSKFHKVKLRVSAAGPSQIPITQALKYVVCENKRDLGQYPLDKAVMSGGTSIYLKKTQSVRFVLDEDCQHLFEIRG